MNRFSRLISWCCLMVAALCATAPTFARDTAPRFGDFPLILAADLPREGRETLQLIRSGGPFPYSKDGSVFSNRERILPKQPRGYYREFTVKTPHARDRGARRIICGGRVAKPQTFDTCYYTDDHYASFKKIKE
ncbi:MAG: ribonuclease [Usitatibacteraceae bacterium]